MAGASDRVGKYFLKTLMERALRAKSTQQTFAGQAGSGPLQCRTEFDGLGSLRRVELSPALVRQPREIERLYLAAYNDGFKRFYAQQLPSENEVRGWSETLEQLNDEEREKQRAKTTKTWHE